MRSLDPKKWRPFGGLLEVRFKRIAWGLCAWLLVACQAEMPQLADRRSPRASLGEEIYKVVCRRLAATQLPGDVAGRETETLCLGDAQSAQQQLATRSFPPALRAFAERRARFIRAVDETLPNTLGSELEQLMRGLVPYYRAPEELIQRGTRSTALLLQQLVQTPLATQGAARVTHDGMVPRGARNGVLRALVAHDDLSAALRVVLPELLREGAAEPFRALREALSLELATSESGDPDERARMRRLVAMTDTAAVSRFASGQPLYSVTRDARGLPAVAKLNGAPVFPFVDRDGDGLADVQGDRFVLEASFQGALPEPYPVLGELAVARDAWGRACALSRAGSDCSALLYDYGADRDATLLSAVLAEAGRLFVGPTSIVESLLRALPILLEAPADTMRGYGARTLSYAGLPEDTSVLLDLTHASTAAFSDPRFEEGLALFATLLANHEDKIAAAITPLLEIERRTRDDHDAYPEASLRKGHLLWDELLLEIERLARARATQGSPSAIAGMLRGVLGYARATERTGQPIERLLSLREASHIGALTALMMRFKDEWRANPRAPKDRAKDEPATLGGFAIPVDRSQPELPVRCGKHGCGGPIVGTVFEPFKLPGQRCLIEQPGRRGLGDDCGAPSNQSIFHRGLGLLAEAADRGQCNRTVGIADLVDEFFSDPCANLNDAPTCTNDAQCASLSLFRPADFACDTTRKLCIARPTSVSCDELKRSQNGDKGTATFAATQAIALDYSCPDNIPSAPCHAYDKQYPAAFIDADGAGPEGAALQPCHAIELPDVGRSFGRAVTHEYTLEIPNPWVRRFIEDVARAGPISDTNDDPLIPDCDLAFRIVDPTKTPPCVPFAARVARAALGEIPPEVHTLGELFELLLGDPALFGNEADTRDLRPDPKVLARVLFSPGNDDEVALFSPLLMRGAPPTCKEAPKLTPCVVESADSLPVNCCIDADNPPLRYRVDTYYGATTFAWEHPVQFTDGTSLAFLDAVRPIADVFNRMEVAAGDLKRLESQSYGLTRLGKLLADHFDSARNTETQSRDPSGFLYRQHTGLVTFERLFADLVDDGKVALTQKGPGSGPLLGDKATAQPALDLLTPTLQLFEAVDGITLANGRDGLDAWAGTIELYANPHAFCAGPGGDDRVLDGRGACDLGGGSRPAPLSFRDGRSYPCWKDGRCFDGMNATPKRFVAPFRLYVEPLRTLLRRGDLLPDAQSALDSVMQGVLDQLLLVKDGQFMVARVPALAQAILRYTRERWAEESASGRLATYDARMVADATDTLTGPVGSALLLTLQALGKSDGARRALRELGEAAFLPAQRRALLASVCDTLELSSDEPSVQRFTQLLAGALAPNVQRALSTPSEPLELNDSVVVNQLRLLDKLSELDDGALLSRVLHNLTGSQGGGQSEAPAELLSELLFAVNRVDPQASTALDGADMAATLRTLQSVMSDEKTGFERLYEIVQCVTAPAGERCD